MHATIKPVHLGHRNGFDWVCYPVPSDTTATFRRRLQQMREAYEARNRRATNA